MIVYKNSKKGFISDVFNGEIVENIANKMRENLNKGVGFAEANSWNNSLGKVAFVLQNSKLPDNAGIAIEYSIPRTQKRVDLIITGIKENSKRAIIIELKQWETAKMVAPFSESVKTYVGGGLREVAHPSYQALSYQKFIEDFCENIDKERISLFSCAYLHNYKTQENDDLFNENFSHLILKAPLFAQKDAADLIKFIEDKIQDPDDCEIINLINDSEVRPSKSLQLLMKNILKGQSEFTLIDEQKVIYEKALEFQRLIQKDGQKRGMIIKGGPGTGKTVIAINLLAKFIENSLTTRYVTKNSAVRNVFKTKLTEKFQGAADFTKVRIDGLFTGSGSFIDKVTNSHDVLIVDEAHRLNAKSGMFSNLGENQIEEIIESAKLSIFFVDDNQIVTTKDIGEFANILNYYNKLGIKEENICVLELESQFRTNGSNAYIDWLDKTLGINKELELDYNQKLNYDVKIFDDVNEMYEKLKEKNSENKARMLSGFTYDWKSKNNPNAYDFEIGNFKKKWNLRTDQTWAISKDSFEQIGCIHTSQGIEFDYVGVIVGNDMMFQFNNLVTDFRNRSKNDASVKGLKSKKIEPAEAQFIGDKIIKNTYKTLMTRAMKGCYIYCVDKPLSEYLKRELARFND